MRRKLIICNRCNTNFIERNIPKEQLQKIINNLQFSHKVSEGWMYRSTVMSLLPCGHLDSHWVKTFALD